MVLWYKCHAGGVPGSRQDALRHQEVGMKKLFSLISLLTLTFLAVSPLQAQTKRIPVAYSAISATQSSFYVAKGGGYLKKQGLLLDPFYVASGTKVAQAVIAGEFPVAAAGGVIVDAVIAGGDIAIIGGLVNVPSFYVVVHPS